MGKTPTTFLNGPLRFLPGDIFLTRNSSIKQIREVDVMGQCPTFLQEDHLSAAEQGLNKVGS